jgi:DNA invertase Pin-like site-specific DNA recombinase
MLRDAGRRRFDLIAAWNVDRLGRSMRGLIEFLEEIHAVGVELFLSQQGVDTTTPAGQALFGMLSVFASFERSILRERVVSGLEQARRRGVRLGRPPLDPATEQRIRRELELGRSISESARLAQVGTSTVKRVKRRMRAESLTDDAGTGRGATDA